MALYVILLALKTPTMEIVHLRVLDLAGARCFKAGTTEGSMIALLTKSVRLPHLDLATALR